jgi:hypothetical protein
MNRETKPELPIIQQTYDLILWFVPLLNRLPRSHRFTLGDRMITGLYDLLEELIGARYAKQKLAQLQSSNLRLEKLRYQTRLLLDLKLIDAQRFAHAAKLTNTVGQSLGNWIKQQS